MKTILQSCTILLLGLLIITQPAWGTTFNHINALHFGIGKNGNAIIRITMNSPLKAKPKSFSIESPARIAIDLPDTKSSLKNNLKTARIGSLQSIYLAQSSEKTRIILTLSHQTPYHLKREKNTLIISLGNQPIIAPPKPTLLSTTFVQTPSSDIMHSIDAIHFHQAPDETAQISVNLSDKNTGINIQKHGNRLIIDFIHTQLPKSLQQKLDVTDFHTPVRTIKTYTEGHNTRMIISSHGLWEHSAIQSDNHFVVYIKPTPPALSSFSQEEGHYHGKKISFNLQNVSVRDILQIIAGEAGLNIITSDNVTGNLTLRLKDVPWDQALDIILQTKGLAMRREGNIIWVAPAKDMAAMDLQKLQEQQEIADMEPLYSETIRLKYKKAEDFKKMITSSRQPILSKRGSAVVDPRTNTVFIEDTAAKLEAIRKLVNQIDVPVRQVMIEARIVEADQSFARDLGARLNLNAVNTNGVTSTSLSGSLTPGDISAVNLPALSNASGIEPGSLAVQIIHGASNTLGLELSALEADGKGKIISNPRLITSDQVEATIAQGTEIPYEQATSSGATSVAFKSAVLSLKVKPQITPDNKIIMDIQVNKDSPGTTTTPAGPPIDTKKIVTQVLINNGDTLVIGGIYMQNDNKTVNKVPFLGDLPFIGAAFRETVINRERTELLIFVTPHILENSGGPDISAPVAVK
ncbi:MAG: type IV pilus secretin PilQ [Pseudomonadota bacterium]|nr:type IV pilus secretin PilQ [Pseudomonadota bacterium]